jgi:hypothetical protein
LKFEEFGGKDGEEVEGKKLREGEGGGGKMEKGRAKVDEVG